MSLKVSN